jgi:hypothetical protein
MELPDNVTADVACAAGDKYFHCVLLGLYWLLLSPG